MKTVIGTPFVCAEHAGAEIPVVVPPPKERVVLRFFGETKRIKPAYWNATQRSFVWRSPAGVVKLNEHGIGPAAVWRWQLVLGDVCIGHGPTAQVAADQAFDWIANLLEILAEKPKRVRKRGTKA